MPVPFWQFRLKNKRGGYVPIGLYNIEEEQHLIRREIAKILSGQGSFPMRVTEFPLVVDDAATEDAVRKVLPEILERIGTEAKRLNQAPDAGDSQIRPQNKIELVPKKA